MHRRIEERVVDAIKEANASRKRVTSGVVKNLLKKENAAVPNSFPSWLNRFLKRHRLSFKMVSNKKQLPITERVARLKEFIDRLKAKSQRPGGSFLSDA